MDADWKRLVREAEGQGWVVERGRKGQTKLVPPDPSKQIVFLHATPSDHRARKNAIAEMKRQGLQWPPSGKAGQ